MAVSGARSRCAQWLRSGSCCAVSTFAVPVGTANETGEHVPTAHEPLAVASSSFCSTVSSTLANPSGARPQPSRTSRYSRAEAIRDTETCGHGSVVEVTIFTLAQAAKPPKLVVEGGAETNAGAMNRIAFGRITLRPPPCRGAVLGDANPARPQIRARRSSVYLDREPVLRHTRIGISGRQPDLRRVLLPPTCQKRQTPRSAGESNTPTFLANYQRAESSGPRTGDNGTAVAAIVEDDGHHA